MEPRQVTIAGKRETHAERKDEKTIYKEHCSDQILRVIELPAEVIAGRPWPRSRTVCSNSSCRGPRPRRRSSRLDRTWCESSKTVLQLTFISDLGASGSVGGSSLGLVDSRKAGSREASDRRW
ncbi:MAG: hypothetical protein DMG27_23795 [Acidobacteria bacterium]|nr:MAG: hypothetical protein DMG27_23795 [Acidobacteriota bacterium]